MLSGKSRFRLNTGDKEVSGFNSSVNAGELVTEMLEFQNATSLAWSLKALADLVRLSMARLIGCLERA